MIIFQDTNYIHAFKAYKRKISKPTVIFFRNPHGNLFYFGLIVGLLNLYNTQNIKNI